MIPCIGLFGRIFGHKMARFCVKDEGPTPEQLEGIRSLNLFISDDKVAAVRIACTTSYVVCCQRCGEPAK